MLQIVKEALGISVDVTVNDNFLSTLILDCKDELIRVGVSPLTLTKDNSTYVSTVISYVNYHASSNPQKQEVWHKIFNEKRLQLLGNKRFKK